MFKCFVFFSALRYADGQEFKNFVYFMLSKYVYSCPLPVPVLLVLLSRQIFGTKKRRCKMATEGVEKCAGFAAQRTATTPTEADMRGPLFFSPARRDIMPRLHIGRKKAYLFF
nr:hypothetical protein [Pandoravirus aubagnensis]